MKELKIAENNSLLELPLDVIHLILLYLPPVTILRLAMLTQTTYQKISKEFIEEHFRHFFIKNFVLHITTSSTDKKGYCISIDPYWSYKHSYSDKVISCPITDAAMINFERIVGENSDIVKRFSLENFNTFRKELFPEGYFFQRYKEIISAFSASNFFHNRAIHNNNVYYNEILLLLENLQACLNSLPKDPNRVFKQKLDQAIIQTLTLLFNLNTPLLTKNSPYQILLALKEMPDFLFFIDKGLFTLDDLFSWSDEKVRWCFKKFTKNKKLRTYLISNDLNKILHQILVFILDKNANVESGRLNALDLIEKHIDKLIVNPAMLEGLRSILNDKSAGLVKRNIEILSPFIDIEKIVTDNKLIKLLGTNAPQRIFKRVFKWEKSILHFLNSIDDNDIPLLFSLPEKVINTLVCNEGIMAIQTKKVLLCPAEPGMSPVIKFNNFYYSTDDKINTTVGKLSEFLKTLSNPPTEINNNDSIELVPSFPKTVCFFPNPSRDEKGNDIPPLQVTNPSLFFKSYPDLPKVGLTVFSPSEPSSVKNQLSN